MIVPALAALFVVVPAQADPTSGQDASQCRVVLEELGNVGLRISDAQALGGDVMTRLRDRMGQSAVIFEGTLNAQLKLRSMVGKSIESQVQDEQIAYLKSCIEQARYRVRVRFGHAKKAHFVTVSCRNADAPPEKVIDEVRFEGATFGKAREAMNAKLGAFCGIMDPPRQAGAEAQPPSKKKSKEWTLPPRRE